MIDEDLNVLQEYKRSTKVYDGHRYDDCPNFVKGHVPELYIENERIKIRYLPCPCKIKHDEERFDSQLITSHHMQRDTLHAKLKDIYMNNRERLDVAMAADQSVQQLLTMKSKGIIFIWSFWYRKIIHIGCYCKST